MVKGISRQVIVVRSPEDGLFEQAIFILKDRALGEGVTGDALMKEAEKIIRTQPPRGKSPLRGFLWAGAGAMVTGLVWLVTVLI